MQDGNLLPTRKNEIFLLISRHNIPPAMFDWEERKYRTASVTGQIGPNISCSVLRCESGYYFAFLFNGINYDPEFSPGLKKNISRESQKIWNQVLELFEQWLHKIKGEMTEPDLWGELEKFRPSFALADNDDKGDGHFLYKEVEQLRDILKIVEENLIIAFKPAPPEQEYLIRQIEYLLDFSKSQKICHWRNMFIGIFMGLGMKFRVPSERIREYWEIILNGFGDSVYFVMPRVEIAAAV